MTASPASRACEFYDVCVVGAGPAGCFTAFHLARAGVRVLVFEEHATVGDPVDCSGIIGAEAFRSLDLPRQPIVGELRSIELVAPSGGTLAFHPPEPLAHVVDRAGFDRSLAERAIAAGAVIRTGRRVVAVDVDQTGAWVRVRRLDASQDHVRVRAVVLAHGPRYQLQQALGMGRPLAQLYTLQAEIPNGSAEVPKVFLGRAIAPGSFAWFLPVRRPLGATMKIGVSSRRGNAGCFERFVRLLKARHLVDGAPIRPKGWMIPVRPIARTYGDRVVAVGDAAGQTKPTTGGGLYYGLLCARLAAETLAEGLRGGHVLSAAYLRRYEARWRAKLGRELRIAGLFRQLIERLSDRQLDTLVQIVGQEGFMRIVRRTADFDCHGDLIRQIFQQPRAALTFAQGWLRSWLPA